MAGKEVTVALVAEVVTTLDRGPVDSVDMRLHPEAIRGNLIKVLGLTRRALLVLLDQAQVSATANSKIVRDLATATVTKVREVKAGLKVGNISSVSFGYEDIIRLQSKYRAEPNGR